MHSFKDRLIALREKLGITQGEMGERLGVRGNYISLLERGRKEPSDTLIRHMELLERAVGSGLFTADTPWPKSGLKRPESQGLEQEPLSSTLSEEPADYRMRIRMIPVIGWAHAGQAASYEELPRDWVTEIPTECRDTNAFGVRLEGDSMEPMFRDGDLLIAMPGEEAYSGCYVVARFANDGVVFRRFEMSGNSISLVPLNDRYRVTEHTREEFSWIYPIWGRWSQLWKR